MSGRKDAGLGRAVDGDGISTLGRNSGGSGEVQGDEHDRLAVLHRDAPGIDIVIERDPDGLTIATVPALYGCRSKARSLDALMLRMREAILLRLTIEGPDPDDLEFVGVHRLGMGWSCRSMNGYM